MDTRQRAEEFTRFAGLELKGAITARGFNATQIAQTLGRSPAAFNRWLNGKVPLPMTVLCEVCEVIGIEPKQIVEYAYDRVAVLDGELDGTVYEEDAIQEASNRYVDADSSDAAPRLYLAASDANYDKEVEAGLDSI